MGELLAHLKLTHDLDVFYRFIIKKAAMRNKLKLLELDKKVGIIE